MAYVDWAGAEVRDGHHVLEALPLDALHPLRHGRLRITLDVAHGVVTACDIDPHLNHRGDERLLEVRDLRQGLALVNRHGWLTAPFAETLFASIVESQLGITVPARALALRELALALNTVAVDALWRHLDASLLANVLDEAPLRERESALQHLEALTGARMHTTYVRVGGVAYDADAALLSALATSSWPSVAAAADVVAQCDGPIGIALPKVVRLPQGEAYAERMTPHGVLGMWIVGNGEKVPLRVHIRTAGFAAFAALERDAVGMPVQEFLLALASIRAVPGEVSR